MTRTSSGVSNDFRMTATCSLFIATQHRKVARKIKASFRFALRSIVDREKRFEARRFRVGKIKVAGKSWVIIGIRLPPVDRVILLVIKTKMHSYHGNTIAACYG